MRRLNARVDVEGRPVPEVARRFLEDEGLVDAEESGGRD
jgi:hypothetical protein